MICSVRAASSLSVIAAAPAKASMAPMPRFSLPLRAPFSSQAPSSGLNSHRPLYLATRQGFGAEKPRRLSTETNAYEADRYVDISFPGEEELSAASQRLKIGVYFATWWALNVVFNIYNKKVLNAFPYPWLTSTLSLAAGSLIMLASWATRVAEPPKTDLDFWKSLAPVSN